MKNILFFLIMIYSIALVAQTKDYSKLKTKELIDTTNSRDKEIRELKKSIENEKSIKGKLESEKKELNSELKLLKKSIKETNAVFLRELFDNKYVKKSYLLETDLVDDDITTRIENSNILVNSILLDETNKDVFGIARKALSFNENYLKLYEIRKNVLFEKCDTIKVRQAIKAIDNLPKMDLDSKLNESKKRIRNNLENYLARTCEVKMKLERLILNPDQNPTFKQEYTKLENKIEYLDYPYLIQIINKVKKNRNDYSKDDLLPCDVAKDDKIEKKEKSLIEPNKTEKSK